MMCSVSLPALLRALPGCSPVLSICAAPGIMGYGSVVNTPGQYDTMYLPKMYLLIILQQE